MKMFSVLAVMASLAGPAAANCVPPPGLSIQQFYATCRNDIDYGYSLGGANKPSHDAWVQMMYRTYQSALPNYNPVIDHQQQQLAATMQSRQNQFMGQMQRQQDQRNANFYQQQKEKSWQNLQFRNYIENQHCAIWTSDHTYCLRVQN